MGINTAVLNIGLAIFPLIGGWLAGYGWKYPYLIILVAIPAALVVFFGMDEPKMQKQQEKLLPYLKDALKCFKQPRGCRPSFDQLLRLCHAQRMFPGIYAFHGYRCAG